MNQVRPAQLTYMKGYPGLADSEINSMKEAAQRPDPLTGPHPCQSASTLALP